MMRPVAQRDFASLKQLLPSVLARVARESGQARALLPIWEEAVGINIARNARPISLEAGLLALEVSNAAWARDLALREPELLSRLNERLGSGTISRLTFRIGP